MKIDGVARLDNTLTFLSPAGDGFRLKIGDVVRADVLSLLEDGTVSIRITLENGKSGVVTAQSRVPLDAGESVLLGVTGGEREIALRFLGVVRAPGDGAASPPGLPGAYRALAAELAAFRLTASDARGVDRQFRSLPESVKESVPGFAVLEGSAGMDALDGAALKKSVEGSGVLLETRLKLAASGDEGPLAVSGGDRKEALLRLGEALREPGTAGAVKASGASPADAAVRADALVSTIESYQLASAAHGILYAPLTLAWDGLADGEILFRKRNRGKGESYTCELNLDLRPLGRMGVSVTMYDGAFFVSFSPEGEEARSRMAACSDEVGERFREAGLALKAVAVQRKRRVAFGAPSADGVDLEV
jgi:hypothetical protein